MKRWKTSSRLVKKKKSQKTEFQKVMTFIENFLFLSIWLLRIKETLSQKNHVYIDRNKHTESTYDYLSDSMSLFSDQNYKNKELTHQNYNFQQKVFIQNEDGVPYYEENWDKKHSKDEVFNKWVNENTDKVSNDLNLDNQEIYLFEPLKSRIGCERVVKRLDPQTTTHHAPLENVSTPSINKPLEEQVSEMLTIFYGKDGKGNVSEKDDRLFVETLLQLLANIVQNENKIYG
ncbi:uncharacterized protein LOC106669102 isoform X2 [Cimex lectularius]|uniref:Uncharacterized protein n=1 Tax=Cimex lectularius TaxID=79782 RepID=A0A8I6S5W4_CIMLE|nr:uncharacterized protein LOC106669102 isoform X2 [Cimex lectularius]